ncbi:MAG: ketol-acid reductoisomerase, partial [Sphingomonadales bacterium]|nr:ketol-acid reductoisomerase [Sphingomonadales bacterium]
MRVYRDEDADPALIRGRRVAVVGYGNQGRAQALNLRDSGVAVTVGLPLDSASRARAAADGCDVMTAAEAVAGADLVAMLAADEDQARIYGEIASNLREGAALLFAHGLNVHFRLIAPRPDLDVLLVAPKGPGTALREEYLRGRGLIAL